MPEDQSAEEVRNKCIAAMGPDLGAIYYELWNDCVWLHLKWQDFTDLYGTPDERIDVLNSAAGFFFRLLQDSLWENLLLRICRITDPLATAGHQNLTLARLPSLVDSSIRPDVERLLASVKQRTEFARDWRNRHIAHADLALALKDQASVPLASANRKMVSEALDAIVQLLHRVEDHYMHSQTVFRSPVHEGSAISLLVVLKDGIDAERARLRRIREGRALPEDYKPRKPI